MTQPVLTAPVRVYYAVFVVFANFTLRLPAGTTDAERNATVQTALRSLEAKGYQVCKVAPSEWRAWKGATQSEIVVYATAEPQSSAN